MAKHLCAHGTCQKRALEGGKYCGRACREKAYRLRKKLKGPSPVSAAAERKLEEQRRELAFELYGNAADFLQKVKPLPALPQQLFATQLADMGFDSRIEAVIPFHDYHYGSLIDPRVNGGFAFYNPDLARERLVRWRDLVLRFTQQWQLTTSVEEAHILELGDDFEGHGKMFGTQAFSIAESIGFQYLGFVDDISQVLLDMLTRYKKIRVFKVHGNHGRVTASAKDSFPPDNFELMAWQNIADRVRASCGGEWQPITQGGVRSMTGGLIDFHIASSPRMLLKIFDYKFLITHGHGMKGIQNTYTGAMATKLAWNSVIGETIDWLVKAHLHEAQQAESEIGGGIIQGGCFVGPSDYSISMRSPAASLPSQELFFMHPKHGKVHHETLHLASVAEMRQCQEWIGS